MDAFKLISSLGCIVNLKFLMQWLLLYFKVPSPLIRIRLFLSTSSAKLNNAQELGSAPLLFVTCREQCLIH